MIHSILISIIIPAYNAEKYIQQCIISLARQDLPQDNYEILVVNDGSTDSTLSILAYIIHSGFISGYQNRYGDNLKPPTNVSHRMTA